jgi:hypothetical protein
MRGSLFLIVVVATLLGLTAAKDKVIQETQFGKKCFKSPGRLNFCNLNSVLS